MGCNDLRQKVAQEKSLRQQRKPRRRYISSLLRPIYSRPTDASRLADGIDSVELSPSRAHSHSNRSPTAFPCEHQCDDSRHDDPTAESLTEFPRSSQRCQSPCADDLAPSALQCEPPVRAKNNIERPSQKSRASMRSQMMRRHKERELPQPRRAANVGLSGSKVLLS